MRKDQWLHAIAQYAKVPPLGRLDGRGATAGSLIDLFAIARAAPPDVETAFAAVSEAELNKVADEATLRIAHGNLALPVGSEATPRELMLALGAQVRALDSFLAETTEMRGPSRFSNEKWRTQFGEGASYLIPRTIPRRPGNVEKSGVSPHGSFAHRALLKHRIIPTTSAGYPVTLYECEAAVGAQYAAYGGALFPALDLKTRSDGKTFVVESVTCPDQFQFIEEQVRAAHLEQCHFLVFPELTIEPSGRERIQNLLRSKPWRRPGESWVPSIVVAGSWHENVDEKCFNVVSVFDGLGELVVQPRKLIPYHDKALGLEAIAPGNEIPILVLDDALVVFGVCRDLCELDASNPLVGLDVDFVLICSFGEESTLEGHLAAAHTLVAKYRAHCFVVQQRTSVGQEVLGYVLSPYDPISAGVAPLRRTQPWTRAPAESGTS